MFFAQSSMAIKKLNPVQRKTSQDHTHWIPLNPLGMFLFRQEFPSKQSTQGRREFLVLRLYGNNAYREEDNTRVYNRSLKDLLNSLYFRSSLHDALITVGCFSGIESNPPLHIAIKGFP